MKKSLVLALAMLALVGCDTKIDDVKKAIIDTQSQVETAFENEGLINDDEVEQNTKDAEKDYKEESIESTINNPSIDEIVRNKSTVDIGDFTDNQIMNAYNNPNSMYEQYLSDSMYWYEVPENQVKDAIKSIISEDFEYAKELGISFDSIPIYSAIDRETYKVREDVYARGKAGSMIGFDINGVNIRDFNSFLYPDIANDYRLMLSTYEVRRYIQGCYSKSVGLGEPLGKWFLSYSGSIDNTLDSEDFPGGITATTLITTSYDSYPCYITIVYKTDESINIGHTLNHIWAMPINLYTLDASTKYRIDALPVLHLITGSGFMYLR